MLASWRSRLNRHTRSSKHPFRLGWKSYRPKIEDLEARCLLTADMVYHWNEMAIEATKIDHGLNAPHLHFGPTAASHALAIESAAVFDAVNSIDRSYTPYLVDVHAPRDASMDAAVAVAAHDTLTALYPYQRRTFDIELIRSLIGIPFIPALEGAAVGSYVARQTLAARAHDGSDDQVDYVYGQEPGQWRADPLHPDAPPLGANWGNVTPFAISSAADFQAPPPPDITSREYADAYNEVKDIGARFSQTRTPEQTDIGIFWGYDAQPGLCAPVRFYNQIAETLSTQMGNTEVQNARFFALVNVAMADAAISVWNDKFTYNYWRPITAIRENDPGTGPTGKGSGNPDLVDQGDVNWEPFGAPAHDGSAINFTPPFPSYTSGHAGIGGALFGIMTHFFGRDDITFTARTDEFNTMAVDEYGHQRPLDPRTFTRFSQAAEENGQSRIYLGIHFRFDKVNGINEGYHIADYVFDHVMQPTGSNPGGPNGGTGDPGSEIVRLAALASTSPSLEGVKVNLSTALSENQAEFVQPDQLQTTAVGGQRVNADTQASGFGLTRATPTTLDGLALDNGASSDSLFIQAAVSGNL